MYLLLKQNQYLEIIFTGQYIHVEFIFTIRKNLDDILSKL